MSLFNLFGKAEKSGTLSASPISSQKQYHDMLALDTDSPYKNGFPKAQNNLGISGEEELRKRAKIILNDADGITQADTVAKQKMDFYLNGINPTSKDISPIVPIAQHGARFLGHKKGYNNVVWVGDLAQLNQHSMKFSVNMAFFPTDNTPHFVARLGIDDGTRNRAGDITPLAIDIQLDVSSLTLRVAIYELIVFPAVQVFLIDERYAGQTEFEAYVYTFENSFNVRTTFLRESEAYMGSLSSYSLFSYDRNRATSEYQKCFDVVGMPISLDATQHFRMRVKFPPAPKTSVEWMCCMV